MGAQLLEAGIGIYNYIKNYGQLDPKTRVLTGASLGASVGFTFGGPIGAGIGAVVGGISGLFKTSGKPKEQKERDQMRKMLQQGGILDDKFTIGLADGTRFDMGIDGKKREEWGGRHYFEPDPADPLAQKTFTIFKELANQMFQGNDNLVNSLAGYLTKASLSNANGDQNKVQENIKFIISQFMGQQAAATPSDASKQTQNQQNTQAVENKKPTEQVSV
jgi:gas vesicle protein